MSRTRRTLNDLPLFATDDELGEAVLGFERRNEFGKFAALCERDGMPRVSPFWGGRYVPAVKAFLDSEQGLAAAAPLAPQGREGTWPIQSARKLRA
jgi:hypothetical protein